MKGPNRTFSTVICLGAFAAALAAPAQAGTPSPDVSEWFRPARHFVVEQGYLTREAFDPNEPMSRKNFTELMARAFGGGYSKDAGYVTAGEVDAALVRALGFGPLAKKLSNVTSPDGWSPGLGRRWGTEVLARNLGLRHDRSTSEERFEASQGDPMMKADIVHAVWKAKTDVDAWAASTLEGFALPNYEATEREVLDYALSLVGLPYVWGGEWPDATPVGYPYGAQEHGGVDCSGFSWMALAQQTSSWNPPGRPYDGWAFPERSSSDMARAAMNRLRFRELKPADVLFFGRNGRDSRARDVYHAAVYLGDGWVVHSSGSRAGVSVDFVGAGSWWRDQFAWGRRIIKR